MMPALFACLPACLLACLPALPVCLLACLSACSECKQDKAHRRRSTLSHPLNKPPAPPPDSGEGACLLGLCVCLLGLCVCLLAGWLACLLVLLREYVILTAGR